MTAKHPTQAMPKDGRAGAADGTNRPSEQGRRGGGDSGGGPYPSGERPAGRKPFAGGQSQREYHGTGQLGDQPVDGQTNQNAPAGSE